MERISDWLYSIGSKSRRNYQTYLETFNEFAQKRDQEFLKIVDEHRAARYAGEIEKDKFLDEWNDFIRAFQARLLFSGFW